MTKNATAKNAEAISECVRRAVLSLVTAQRELKDALQMARDDYDHNADKLEQLVGGLGLIASIASQEHSTWRSYADARHRNARGEGQ